MIIKQQASCTAKCLFNRSSPLTTCVACGINDFLHRNPGEALKEQPDRNSSDQTQVAKVVQLVPQPSGGLQRWQQH
ncbi:hypothetical protein GN956_G6787 [Arapaima gigas]